MAVETLFLATNVGNLANLSVNNFFPIQGFVWISATEAIVAQEQFIACTLSQLVAYGQALFGSATLTMGSRIGGSTGNLSVALTGLSNAGPTVGSDTTHTDSVSSTNLINTISAATSGFPELVATNVRTTSANGASVHLFDDGSNSGAGIAYTGTTPQFEAPSGKTIQKTTEADAQAVVRSPGTWQALTMYVKANTTAVASTVTSRVAGSAGNQTLTIGIAATGRSIDTTHTDSISSLSLIDIKVVPGDSNVLTAQYVRSEVSLSSSTWDSFNKSGNIGTNFYPVGAVLGSNATESYTQAQDHTAQLLSFLRIAPSSVTNVTFRTRVNGVNGNSTITSTTATVQTDTTHTDSVAADTTFNYQGSGSGTAANWVGLTLGPATQTETSTVTMAFSTISMSAAVSDSHTSTASLAFSGVSINASVNDHQTNVLMSFGGISIGAGSSAGETTHATLSFSKALINTNVTFIAETTAVSLNFNGVHFASHLFVRPEMAAVTLSFSPIRIFANVVKPGAPGTGLTQFWTF